MARILLIGGGNGGKAVLSRLLQFKWVMMMGVVDPNPKAPGMRLAQEAEVPVFTQDAFEVLGWMDVDLVFDLTGDPQIGSRLINQPGRSFDVVTGQATYLIWDVIRELEEKETQLQKELDDHHILAEIGLMLFRPITIDQVYDAIVMGGMRMTEMPIGSLSVVNAEKQELCLVAAKGFSSDFYKRVSYPIRPGGLSAYILSHQGPVLVPDISNNPAFNYPVLLKEGIQSLVALPLISEKGPIGILYNDDFRPRTLTPSVVENLNMLATQAVTAIQKQHDFEQIKNLSTQSRS